MNSKELSALVKRHLDACEKQVTKLEGEKAELEARLLAVQGQFDALLAIAEQQVTQEEADALRFQIAELKEQIARWSPVIDAVEDACHNSTRKYGHFAFFPLKRLWRDYLKKYHPDTWRTGFRKP